MLNLNLPRVTDAGMKHIAGLPNLNDLSLFQHVLTDEGIGRIDRLPKLQSLNLYGTQLTNVGLAPDGRFPQCTSIDARDTRVTPAQVAALRLLLRREVEIEAGSQRGDSYLWTAR